MLDDIRLDAKLGELAKELRQRPLIPGYAIADAFTMRGIDEAGQRGMFAAVLLPAEPPAELDTLTRFRQALTQKLKQVHTHLPAWPIVVQGEAELVDGQDPIPGGKAYFNELRQELQVRRDRAHTPTPAPELIVAAPPGRPTRAAGRKAVKRARVAPARRSAHTTRARARR